MFETLCVHDIEVTMKMITSFQIGLYPGVVDNSFHIIFYLRNYDDWVDTYDE